MEFFKVCLEAISRNTLQDARISRVFSAVTRTISAVPCALTAEIFEKEDASNHTIVEQTIHASAARRCREDNRKCQFNLRNYR